MVWARTRERQQACFRGRQLTEMRAHAAALGGSVGVVARLGGRSWKIA